jgi:regulator-associated protein of mTOR
MQANCHSGTQKHRVKIFNINTGQPVSYFEPYSGFLRDRSAPIAATAFHPHRLMIAAAALHDNHVNIFGCHGPKHTTSKTVKLWEGPTTNLSRVSTMS